MKTNNIKVGQEYIFKDNRVTVLKRIKGRETSKRNMQSGVLYTAQHRTRKRFLLSNGDEVFSDKLSSIINL